MSLTEIIFANLDVYPDGTNVVFQVDDTDITLHERMTLKDVSEPAGNAPSGFAFLYLNPTTERLELKDDAGVVTQVCIDATDSAKGIVELATSAEVTTGSATDRAVTPASLGPKGGANGFASLDGTGKIPTAQLPASVTGAVAYQGAWDADTNSPTLASGTGTQGHYYVVSVAGTTTLDGISEWAITDWVVYNGTAWEKIDNTEGTDYKSGNDIQFPTTSNPVLHVDGDDKKVGINDTSPDATFDIAVDSGDKTSSGLIVETFVDANAETNPDALGLAFAVEPDLQLNHADRRKTRILKGTAVAVASTNAYVNYPDGEWMVDIDIFSTNDTKSEVWIFRGLYRLVVTTGAGVVRKIKETGNTSSFTVAVDGSTTNQLKVDWTHSATTADFTVVYTYTALVDITTDPTFHQ